ncbi:twin-arginine translocation signal domain-containing protein [Halorussus gelatinilyticus]|uniref:Twin-arginine translocation signal domain-containing protein n=1 Tax=Halorussus gelatinilyticus TaxID=2937524 RepID=A0A8U0IPM0_9EURY|nr:twin-arginine translocation signal domain-containing protein [Halorussus gelatinilyticus]UPW02084.1 twin-arginine translocation signal domain-containing protein [Halorussus gelatinilyticus]
MSENNSSLNRRRFLKQTTATGALAIGATANVTAKETANVERLDSETLQSELAAHGDDLAQMLRAEGVLASMAALENPRRTEAKDETEQVVGEAQVEDGFLTVHVEPESNRAFGTLWSEDTVTFYDPQDGVTTQDVDTMSHNCWCSDYSCSSEYDYQKCYQNGDTFYGRCNCF